MLPQEWRYYRQACRYESLSMSTRAMVGHDQTAPVSDLHRADLRPDLDRLGAALAGGSWQEAAPAAFRLSIPALALFFAVLILTDGLGEELGWRGFALPRAPAALAGGDGQCHWCGRGCLAVRLASLAARPWTSAPSRSCFMGFRANPGKRADRRAAACIDQPVRSLTGDHQPKPTGAQKSER
jgi:hypothetical protein